MKTARDHAPYHDIPMFGGDEIGVAWILRVQHGAAVARQQSLDRQLPIEHGHHHIAVLGRQRTVHDQPIAVPAPSMESPATVTMNVYSGCSIT